MKISRRNFIKGALATAVSLSFSSQAWAEESEKRFAILFNGFNCVGCEICQLACKERNGLPKKFETILSPRTYVYVSAGVRKGKEVRVRYSCMHCGKAPCLEACPVRAIRRSKSGFVYIDQRHCIGCQYCIAACHYGVPKFDPENKVSSKCHGCFDIVEKGKKPACVEACPWNALDFGKRDEIIEKAKNIAKKKNGYVYGIKEAGGLGVIYVLPVDAEEVGIFPRVRKEKSIYPADFIYEPILVVLMPIVGYYIVKEYIISKEVEEK